MMTIRKLALASVSFISLAMPAFAAEAEDAKANADDETIIVQARRRDENVQDVPQVINAVTAEQISKLNIRDVREITSVVPGLSLVSNGNGIGSSSSMRGVNHDVNVSANNGTIQYYINEVPASSNLTLQAMFDIAQISVERGPQGCAPLLGPSLVAAGVAAAPVEGVGIRVALSCCARRGASRSRRPEGRRLRARPGRPRRPRRPHTPRPSGPSGCPASPAGWWRWPTSSRIAWRSP